MTIASKETLRRAVALAGAAALVHASAGLAEGQAVGAGLAPAEQAREPVAAMPPLKPAEIDEALAIGGEEIDTRKLRSRMTVDVRVNGQGPYRFVVDSGADTSVVGENLVERLKLPPGSPIMLNGMTETRLVNQAMVDTLRLGPTEIAELEVPVLKERDIGGDGMIGLDALVEQRLMLDFEKRLITVDDGRTPEPVMDGVIVVRGRMRRGQLILTQVKTGNVGMDAVVDTGSEITIGNRALRDQLARRSAAKISTIKVYGVTGNAIDLELITVPTLKLGPVTLQNVPIAFADLPPFKVFGIDKKPALLLGTDVMETFRRVSLDFHNRKVRFQLRRCESDAIVLRTSTIASRLSTDTPTVCAR